MGRSKTGLCRKRFSSPGRSTPRSGIRTFLRPRHQRAPASCKKFSECRLSCQAMDDIYFSPAFPALGARAPPDYGLREANKKPLTIEFILQEILLHVRVPHYF